VTNENVSLQHGNIGTLDCVMILVGGMVGSAIFSLSGLTYVTAGPASILSWILAAGILLLYGLQVAELTSIYPRSGGLYVYPYEALGKTKKGKEAWGWISAWGLLNVNIFGAAFSAIYIATYLGVAFPALGAYQIPLAILFCVICTLLNVLNVSVMGKANIILVLGLIVAMLIYAFNGFGHFSAANFTPFFTQGVGGGGGFISAIPTAMLAYGAIISVAMMVSEVKNPKKTISKSMVVSMIITVAMYAIVLISTIGMIGVQYLLENPGMTYIPMFAAAWSVMYDLPWLVPVISIAAVLALTTTLLVLTAAASRVTAAVAADGLLPKGLAKVNEKNGVPVRATIAVMVLTTLLSCLPQFTAQIVNTGAICSAITVIIVAVTLLAARKQNTYVEGNFKLGGGSFFPILTILLVAIFIIPGVFQPLNYWGLALAWYAVGVVILLIAFAANRNSAAADKKSA